VFEYCLIATAMGPVGLAWSENGLLRLQLPSEEGWSLVERLKRVSDKAVETDPPGWLAPTVVRLQHYFNGIEVDLSECRLDLDSVSPFFRSLYLEMLNLKWGETVTYGELAERVGAAGAARAVGQAMGKNPIPIIVPCHRVLASGNKTGGFSAPGGTRTKLKLLEMEGVQLGLRNVAQMAFAF
jgi:methylated-DNA-[protein]-cysteine S-methyltransferase